MPGARIGLRLDWDAGYIVYVTSQYSNIGGEDYRMPFKPMILFRDAEYAISI